MNHKKRFTHRDWIVTMIMATFFVACGGSTEDDGESVPIHVPSRPTDAQIAIAKDRTCVVERAGRVQCWGSNENHKLGTDCSDICEGTEGKAPCCLSPVTIPNLVEVAQLALGNEHSCALLRDGTVMCWGANRYGQLGDGSLQESTEPRLVPNLADVRQLVAGDDHTCALLGDSTVQCWGSNNSGQLGDGTMKERLSPTVVPHLRGVKELAAGWRVSCALLGDGRAQCWGSNELRDIGPWWRCTQWSDRTGDQACPFPRDVPDVKGITHITASGCALTENGRLTCWSDGGILAHHTAHDIAEFGSVTLFDKMWNNRCAVDSTGVVRCLRLTLADLGKTKSPDVVADLPNLPGTRQLAVAADHACALGFDDRVRCWGENHNGQLGDGTTVPHASAATVRW